VAQGVEPGPGRRANPGDRGTPHISRESGAAYRFALVVGEEQAPLPCSWVLRQVRRSLTLGSGKEMAGHSQFTVASGVPVFFCYARSPWQRGTNENTNGLLRHYLRFADCTHHELDVMAAELNGQPRKTLDWQTPAQALDAALP
jgi:hypothetical protein